MADNPKSGWARVGPTPEGDDSEDGRKEIEVFLGEYFHSLDEKGRMVLPSGFRRRLEDGCVITKGQDGQLMVYTLEAFERMAGEVADKPGDKDNRRFSRTVFAGADLQTMDKSGRVIIKPDLRTFSRLGQDREVAVLGVFDHVELWNKEDYLADRARGDERYLEEDT